MRRRLLALDLDGTLLRRDGTVDPRDVAAIKRAREAGVHVVPATGRLVHGTLPTAQRLELDGMMVCGDGATIASAVDGSVIDARAVDRATTEQIVGMLLDHALVPFVFSHGEIHADERARDLDPWVRIWSERIHWHANLVDTHAWRTEGDVAMTLGLGEDDDVSMFKWAGRSFVMNGAPEGVCAVATDRLECVGGTGGGVAEAIERWLR
jgi:hydroxymethylpyrimidine pyrophosphatase-like HAD family hydrolase